MTTSDGEFFGERFNSRWAVPSSPRLPVYIYTFTNLKAGLGTSTCSRVATSRLHFQNVCRALVCLLSSLSHFLLGAGPRGGSLKTHLSTGASQTNSSDDKHPPLFDTEDFLHALHSCRPNKETITLINIPSWHVTLTINKINFNKLLVGGAGSNAYCNSCCAPRIV